MKLKTLRKHYQSVDGGRSWIPKRAFDTVAEAEKEGFLEKWTAYVCPICSKIHIGREKETT